MNHSVSSVKLSTSQRHGGTPEGLRQLCYEGVSLVLARTYDMQVVCAEVFNIVARDQAVLFPFPSSHVLDDIVKPYCLSNFVPQEHHCPSFSSILKVLLHVVLVFCYPRHPIVFLECEQPRVISVHRGPSICERALSFDSDVWLMASRHIIT